MMTPLRGGWWLCELRDKNDATGNTKINWRLYPDIAAVGNTGDILFHSAMAFRNCRAFPGYLAPEDKQAKPVLTGAKWNTLAGNATPGVYAANQITSMDFTTGWVNTSITVTALPGEGIGGVSAYRIADNSGSVFANTAFTRNAVAATSDWAYMEVFVNRTSYTGQKLEYRPTFLTGGTTLAPRIDVDVKAR
jgi:hypothetical protein